MEKAENTNIQKSLSPIEWLQYVTKKADEFNNTRIRKAVIISDKKIMSWYIKGKSQEIEFSELENGFSEITVKAVITVETC